MAWCLKAAGVAYPKHWYRALDYVNYGTKLLNPLMAVWPLSPTIPANLIEPYPDLQQLEDGTGRTLLLWSVDTVAKYNDCKSKHSVIVKALI